MHLQNGLGAWVTRCQKHKEGSQEGVKTSTNRNKKRQSRGAYCKSKLRSRGPLEFYDVYFTIYILPKVLELFGKNLSNLKVCCQVQKVSKIFKIALILYVKTFCFQAGGSNCFKKMSIKGKLLRSVSDFIEVCQEMVNFMWRVTRSEC